MPRQQSIRNTSGKAKTLTHAISSKSKHTILKDIGIGTIGTEMRSLYAGTTGASKLLYLFDSILYNDHCLHKRMKMEGPTPTAPINYS